MNRDMTTGSPLKLILMFFVPTLVGNLFQQFYNMADSIIVGKFVGVKALAAVGSTGALNFMILGFVTGLCGGFGIPMAQYFGAHDFKKLRHCIANAFYLTIGLIVVLTIGVLLLTEWMLTMMHTPEDIFQDTYTYISIVFGGLGATMFYNLLNSICRAMGNIRTPLYFLILASFLNIGLDLLFILVFHMGVAGAAYATVIAQAVAGILCFLFMLRSFPELRMDQEERKLSFRTMGHLLYMGLPMALQFSITAVGSIVLQTSVNTFGSGVVAAVTAANKVQSILTQPMEAMGLTMATFSGQNAGARRIDRIQKGIRQSLLVVMIYGAVAWAVAAFFGTQISLLFLDQGEQDILIYVDRFLKLAGMFLWMLGVLLIYRNAVQGLGYAIPAMAAGVMEMIARVWVVFWLVDMIHFDAICLSSPIAWLFATLFLIPFYLYQTKRMKRKFELEDATEKAVQELEKEPVTT